MRIRPFAPGDAEAVNAVALAAFAQYRDVYSDWEALALGVVAILGEGGPGGDGGDRRG
jgi:hypothetical protein